MNHRYSAVNHRYSAVNQPLLGGSLKVVSERTVFENPRNSAEKVTLTELEVDHSCTWETALAMAGAQEILRDSLSVHCGETGQRAASMLHQQARQNCSLGVVTTLSFLQKET